MTIPCLPNDSTPLCPKAKKANQRGVTAHSESQSAGCLQSIYTTIDLHTQLSGQRLTLTHSIGPRRTTFWLWAAYSRSVHVVLSQHVDCLGHGSSFFIITKILQGCDSTDSVSDTPSHLVHHPEYGSHLILLTRSCQDIHTLSARSCKYPRGV